MSEEIQDLIEQLAAAVNRDASLSEEEYNQLVEDLTAVATGEVYGVS